MEDTTSPEQEPKPAVSRSWAEVQREAPVFQTETAAAGEQAVQEAALQGEAAPEVCSPGLFVTTSQLTSDSSVMLRCGPAWCSNVHLCRFFTFT